MIQQIVDSELIFGLDVRVHVISDFMDGSRKILHNNE